MSDRDLYHLLTTSAPVSKPPVMPDCRRGAAQARWLSTAARERRAYAAWASFGGCAAWIRWRAAAEQADAALAELAAARA